MRAAAEAWAGDDPDPETRAEVEAMLAADDRAALREHFGSRLEFGTAGLRGKLGAGPNRMNRALVRRAAAGMAHYLQQRGTTAGGVVIGYDARHLSYEFATDSAAVIAGAGITARVLPRCLPTPLLAYAIGALGADAGIMVTASHNPPEYNGYKVYLGDGAQIIPPTDQEISSQIAAVGSLASVPLAPPDDPRMVIVGEEVVDRYLADGLRLAFLPDARNLAIVYTAMHGVGGSVATRLLAEAGFGDVSVVGPQFEPDPDFPTVAFPNPEEPGALDLALAEARARGAELVLANDPDADRLGVAVPLRSSGGGPPAGIGSAGGIGTPGGRSAGIRSASPGAAAAGSAGIGSAGAGRAGAGAGWRQLTGDEIGVLLADHILRHTEGDDRLVVTSIVSSTMLARMAASAGVHFLETLTGFKWLARSPDSHPGWRFVFGYEEALGYCVGTMVRDKDGITAALVFAELVAALKVQGRTVHDRLDDLAIAYGAHVTTQWSSTLTGPDGPTRIRSIVDRLRADPPASLAGNAVTGVVDLAAGDRGLPPTDGIVLYAGERIRAIIRPSGTEPKVKVYFEVVEPVVDADAAGARARGAELIARSQGTMAEVTGLPL